jgi:hypothetical protein
MVIILIRRFVRSDRIEHFLETYRKQTPVNNRAFKGETLARVNEDTQMPPGLSGFVLKTPDTVTVLNIARWDSWETFAEQFAEELKREVEQGFDREIETAPRQRVVLDVIEVHPSAL